MTTPPWQRSIDRAGRDLALVEEGIQAFLATEPYEVRAGVEEHALLPPSQVFYYVARGYVVKQPSPELAELLGDSVEKMRSGLDRLVWALADQAGAATNKTCFPVCRDSSAFGRKADGTLAKGGLAAGALAGLDPAAFDVVESLQPYQGVSKADFDVVAPDSPRAVTQHPLYLLNYLRQVNFHRHPHVTGSIVDQTNLGFNEMKDVRVTFSFGSQMRRGPFEDGTELLRVQCRVNGPEPAIHLGFRARHDVAFGGDGPTAGLLVVPTLRQCLLHISLVVVPALAPFLT